MNLQKRALSVTALIPIVNDQLTYKAGVFAEALVALKYLNVVGGTTFPQYSHRNHQLDGFVLLEDGSSMIFFPASVTLTAVLGKEQR